MIRKGLQTIIVGSILAGGGWLINAVISNASELAVQKERIDSMKYDLAEIKSDVRWLVQHHQDTNRDER